MIKSGLKDMDGTLVKSLVWDIYTFAPFLLSTHHTVDSFYFECEQKWAFFGSPHTSFCPSKDCFIKNLMKRSSNTVCTAFGKVFDETVFNFWI